MNKLHSTMKLANLDGGNGGGGGGDEPPKEK